MMIKFRGKRIDSGEWVYGHYIRYEHMGVIKHIIVTNWAQVYINSFEVHPATVGQFTGLKDSKNGREIYEGDICKYWMDSVWKYGYVFWNQGGFALKVFRMGKKTVDVVFKFQAFIPVPDDGETMTDQFEVIGNIYDNPELLEGVAG